MMSSMANHAILSFARKNEYLLVFFACGALLALLQLNPSFPDPDSFYHARIALEMASGPVLSFSALPFTVLSDLFIDHHFLYHALLVPFVIIFNPLVGLKIATVIFAAIFLAFFYYILRQHGNASRTTAIFFLVLLVLNVVFLFRLNLAKIPAVSLIVFFAGLIAIMKERYARLFGLSFLYVWLYGGWPILPFSSFIAWIAIYLSSRKNVLINGIQSWRTLNISTSKMPFLPIASFSGALAGLIINPYFPTNIFFTWVQTFKIAALNVLSNVPVGNEWYPPGASFIPSHGPTLFLLVFSFIAYAFPGLFAFVFRTSKPTRSWQKSFLCCLTVLFLVFTLKSRRYGEYFAPLATLFSCMVLAPLISKESIQRFLSLFRKNLCLPNRALKKIITVYFLLAAFAVVFINITQSATNIRSGSLFSKYENGFERLRQVVPKNAIIFHDRWDDFPLFYYRAPEYRYISGLDPRFFFEKDPERAKQYTVFSVAADMTETFGYRSLCAVAFLSREKDIDENAKGRTLGSALACSSRFEKKATADFIASFRPSAVVITNIELGLAQKIPKKNPGGPEFYETYKDSEMVILQLRE